MKLFSFLILFFFVSVASASEGVSIYSCLPELGDGQEVVGVIIESNELGSKASLFVNNVTIENAQKAPVVKDGDINNYKEKANWVINLSSGASYYFERDFDELVLDIGELKLNLSDYRFMCEQWFLPEVSN